MHYIQNKILHTLTLTDKARYSQIKPQGIESNLFIYHLKQTIRDQLVLKNEDGSYSLSNGGQAYVDTVSLSNFKLRSQPKIVNLIACSNNRGQWLLYKRKHQPFIGLVGFPYGKIHLGETIKQSSERELHEKTDLQVQLEHRGDVYITVYQGGHLIIHTLFHIHEGKNPTGSLKEETDIGFCFWSDVESRRPDLYFPGFLEVLKLIKKPTSERFFEEFTFNLP